MTFWRVKTCAERETCARLSPSGFSLSRSHTGYQRNRLASHPKVSLFVCFFFFKSKLARNQKFIRCLCDSKQHACLVMWSRNGKNMLLPDKQVFLSLHAMNNQTCIIKPAMSTAEEVFGRSLLMKSMKESEGKRLYNITLQGSNVSNTGGSFFFEDLSYFTAKMWIMTLSCCLF